MEIITVAVDGDHVNVTRNVDDGLKAVKLKLPVITTTASRLSELFHASSTNIKGRT